MLADFKVPPSGVGRITPPRTIAKRLSPLLGRPFFLTGKTRTDGANLRRLVAEALSAHKLPPPAESGSWQYADPKKKGLPRILREVLDTYLVTSGGSYNLQVWNRNPSAASVQIQYSDGAVLNANDVRFALVRVDTTKHVIRAIAVLTPEYIVEKFGDFGKPIVKEQLIISRAAQDAIHRRAPPLLFYADDENVAKWTSREVNVSNGAIQDAPSAGDVIALDAMRAVLVNLIGRRIQPRPTKSRGQELELHVAQMLGYDISADDAALCGGFPDIRHQALEVKIQDAPTVDLGRFSPQFPENVPGCPGFTTETIRYLIALMDVKTNTCTGLVLCPGNRLGEHFTYVADQSFKCQRSMSMSFFDAIDGKSVFNPHVR